MGNLTPEQIAQILATKPGEAGVNIDGTFYQPHYASNAEGEAGQGQGGQLLDIYGYDPTKTDVGQQYGMYGSDGQYQGQGAFKKVKDGDLMAMALLSGFGMSMLNPGALGGGLGGGAGATGAVAGDAMMPGALAQTGGLSMPYGSVLPGLEAYLAPAAAAGEAAGAVAGDAFMPGAFASSGGLTAPYGSVLPGMEGFLASGAGSGAAGAFNAAKDSQAANAAIDASGGNALSGYDSMYGLPTSSPVAPGLLDTAKNLASQFLPEGAGLNMKTLAAALPLLGLAAGKGAQGSGGGATGGTGRTPAQEEYFNRPQTQWDWDRIQRDAKAAGTDLTGFLASNWARVTRGDYNMPQPVKLAHGGGLDAMRFVQGGGTGRSDSIPAELSDGEYVLDAETVAMLGDGSNRAGAQQLDAMRKNLRAHKGQALAQGQFSPNAKNPLAYLQGGK